MGEFADPLAGTDFRVSRIIDEIEVLDVADDSAGRWNQIDNAHIPLCAHLDAYHSHPFRQSWILYAILIMTTLNTAEFLHWLHKWPHRDSGSPTGQTPAQALALKVT
jgi:hypothetical protein